MIESFVWADVVLSDTVMADDASLSTTRMFGVELLGLVPGMIRHGADEKAVSLVIVDAREYCARCLKHGAHWPVSIMRGQSLGIADTLAAAGFQTGLEEMLRFYLAVTLVAIDVSNSANWDDTHEAVWGHVNEGIWGMDHTCELLGTDRCATTIQEVAGGLSEGHRRHFERLQKRYFVERGGRHLPQHPGRLEGS